MANVQEQVLEIEKEAVQTGEEYLRMYGKITYAIQRELLQTNSTKEADTLLNLWKEKMDSTCQYLKIEMDKDLLAAFDNAKAENREEIQVWESIADAADQASTFSQKLLKLDLQKHIESSLEKASPSVQDQVHQAADQMFEEMGKMEQTEKEHGASPETWRDLSDQHAPEIKQNLQDLKKSLEESAKAANKLLSAAVSVAITKGGEKVCSAFQRGTAFLRKEQTKIQERNPELQKELAEIKELLKSIQTELKTTNLSKDQRIQISTAIGQVGTKLLEKVADKKEQLQKSPFRIIKMYRDMRQKAADIKKTVVEFPEKVKNATENKLAQIVDVQTKRITSTIDKAIQSLEQRRQSVVDLSQQVQQTIVGEKPVQKTQENSSPKQAKKDELPLSQDPPTVVAEAMIKDVATQKDNEVPVDKMPGVDEAVAGTPQKTVLENPLLALDDVKNAKSITELQAGSDEQGIYFSYLKAALQENPQLSNEQADEKVIAALGKEHMDYQQIKDCIACSPAIKNQKLSSEEEKMLITKKVFAIVNPVLTQMQEVKNAKPVIELRRWSSASEVYYSHLKKTLTENPLLKTEEANKKIVENLLKAKMDTAKIKDCLLYAPNVAKKQMFEKKNYIRDFVDTIAKKQEPQQELSR